MVIMVAKLAMTSLALRLRLGTAIGSDENVNGPHAGLPNAQSIKMANSL